MKFVTLVLDLYLLNPRTSIDLVIVHYQDKLACLRPYNTLQSCQTLFSFPGNLKPSGCSI